MKKIFLLVLACCMLCATAMASPKLYRHPGYSFGNLHNVKLTVITNKHPENSGSFHADEMAEEKVLSALYSSAGNAHIVLTDERANGPIAPTGAQDSYLNSSKNAPKTVELRVSINYLGYRTYVVPGHYEQKTTYFKQKRTDRYGKESYIEVPITNEVWVPDTYHKNALMDIIYNIHDLETATVIANVMDRREREYEEDTAGMLGRSTRDFFKALTKK